MAPTEDKVAAPGGDFLHSSLQEQWMRERLEADARQFLDADSDHLASHHSAIGHSDAADSTTRKASLLSLWLRVSWRRRTMEWR